MKDKQQKLVEFFYFCLFQQLINVQIVNLKTSVAVLTLGKLFESKQRMTIENKTEDSKKNSNRIGYFLSCAAWAGLNFRKMSQISDFQPGPAVLTEI